MPVQAFSFPETRFFKAGRFIYKFRIRGGTSCSQEDVMGEDRFSQEFEEIIRTVLGNLDNLQPFSSPHYTVFPYKKRQKCVCKHDKTNLRVYPFTLILYLEKNTQNGPQSAEENEETQHIPSTSEPQSKRCKRDSPLEEAILKDLIKGMEAENRVAVTGKLDLGSQHSQRKTEEDPGHIDKPETIQEEEGTPETPVRRGYLKQLASHIFPFSRFFKDPEN
ncbi:membrane-anchored junction protein isoform X2 [Archocentrus centrarchus]|uniref:membrane-anchored junction protein isoform X2 n=1 Tax=Archocentrus centrarchus TaxID=63155 RepID=UPI0011EA3C73|nr:membrane-anchored junction protein isoform X2 [Archocentrus centrarchus]